VAVAFQTSTSPQQTGNHHLKKILNGLPATWSGYAHWSLTRFKPIAFFNPSATQRTANCAVL